MPGDGIGDRLEYVEHNAGERAYTSPQPPRRRIEETGDHMVAAVNLPRGLFLAWLSRFTGRVAVRAGGGT